MRQKLGRTYFENPSRASHTVIMFGGEVAELQIVRM